MAFPFDSFFIGPVEVKPALVLAPLHEITDLPFRRMIREIGGLGLTVSEMISAEALWRQARKAKEMMASEGERPFAMQLAGYIPEHLAECTRMCEEAGADLVDLNMGCPASNVTSGGAGSALLRDFRLAERCVQAMVKAVKIPVTVKMRVGWDAAQKERGNTRISCGCSRPAGSKPSPSTPGPESSSTSGTPTGASLPGPWKWVSAFPIIGNGDVNRPEEAHQMVRETGCAGVMIGRGAMYNPFLFKQILDPDLEVSPDMRIDATLRFFRLTLEAGDERAACTRSRKSAPGSPRACQGAPSSATASMSATIPRN